MIRIFLISALIALTFPSSLPAMGQEQDPIEAVSPPAVQSDHPGQEKSLLPDTVSGLEDLARSSYQEGNYIRYLQANMKLRKMRPYTPDYMVGMVIACSLVKKQRAAYDNMLRMQQQGLSYDFTTTDDTEFIRSTQVFEYINDLLIRAGEPMGEGEVAFELPGESQAPDAIDWDGSREKILVGSQVSGAIIAVSQEGEFEELIKADDKNGLWAIKGLLVDQANNRLWVTSAALPGFSNYDAGDEGMSALFEFNLESLEPLRRYEIPDDDNAHVLGAMALSPQGDLYIVDHATSVVFRKPTQAETMAAYIGNPELTSLSDIAISADGNSLYIADREMGVQVIDLAKQTSAMLSGPENLNLGGIESLLLWENNLAIVQSGIQPQRLMRLEIDATGGNVTSVTPMAIALVDFDHPGQGTIVGDHVYYLANSAERGAGQENEQFIVMRTPLESGQEIIPPDMRKFEEETLSKARNKQK